MFKRCLFVVTEPTCRYLWKIGPVVFEKKFPRDDVVRRGGCRRLATVGTVFTFVSLTCHTRILVGFWDSKLGQAFTRAANASHVVRAAAELPGPCDGEARSIYRRYRVIYFGQM